MNKRAAAPFASLTPHHLHSPIKESKTLWTLERSYWPSGDVVVRWEWRERVYRWAETMLKYLIENLKQKEFEVEGSLDGESENVDGQVEIPFGWLHTTEHGRKGALTRFWFSGSCQNWIMAWLSEQRRGRVGQW